jgi:hypothetical protein
VRWPSSAVNDARTPSARYSEPPTAITEVRPRIRIASSKLRLIRVRAATVVVAPATSHSNTPATASRYGNDCARR